MSYKSLSFIIPVRNEKNNISPITQRLSELAESRNYSYEIIFIEDGSSDDSLNMMLRQQEKNPNIIVAKTLNCHGKGEALEKGFEAARNNIVITIDADLQEDPNEIPNLIKKLEDGYDAVFSWRTNREDKIYKKLRSRIFNLLVNSTWKLNLHDQNCGLKAFRRHCTQGLDLSGGRYRFISVILKKKGLRITEIPVSHRKRLRDKSKYRLLSSFSAICDYLKFAASPRSFSCD